MDPAYNITQVAWRLGFRWCHHFAAHVTATNGADHMGGNFGAALRTIGHLARGFEIVCPASAGASVGVSAFGDCHRRSYIQCRHVVAGGQRRVSIFQRSKTKWMILKINSRSVKQLTIVSSDGGEPLQWVLWSESETNVPKVFASKNRSPCFEDLPSPMFGKHSSYRRASPFASGRRRRLARFFRFSQLGGCVWIVGR